MKSNTETQQNEQTKNHISTSYSLVLYNDDVNTFDHVINCLIRICKHDVLQAEQCAWLVHNKGKCNVKSGKLSDLRKMQNALVNNGLSAEIE
jgi:ATP-dependent Clp protease adaptor protein ClpS